MDLVDVDSAKWAQYAQRAAFSTNLLYGREARVVGRLEREALRRCDAVVLVSRTECDLLAPGDERVVPVGNGVDTSYFTVPRRRTEGPATLVFTGTMDYRPNVEGVCWFAERVWPRLRQQVSELRFIIVGRDPTPAVRRLAERPGIEVTGTVPDVRPYLAEATVAVCPLRIARGVQNKVLEAMASALPVVATHEALVGLDVQPGREVLEANSPEQWLDALVGLIGDERTRQQIGRQARRCVEQRYTWEAQLAPLVSLCEELARPDGEARGNRRDR